MSIKRLKINICLYSLLRTGGIRVLYEYANYLTEMGHDVVVYYSLIPYNEKKSYSARENYYRVRNKLIDFKREKNNLANYENVNFKIKLVPVLNNFFVRDADASIFSYWPIAYQMLKLNSTKGERIYLVQAYETWGADLDLLHNTYLLGFCNITVSSFLQKLLVEKSGASSKVIMNGIDFKKFYPVRVEKKKGINIAFIYYPMEYKGYNEILAAIEKARSKYDDLSFTSFGMNFPENPPDYIEYFFDPSDTKIREIYSRADIFISASREEGFYLTPAEAMACKCAVITTNVGAVPEFSKDKETALHVSPDNPEQIFDALSYLLSNRSEIDRISENGFNMVKDLLRWDISTKKLETIILDKINISGSKKN